LFSFSWSRLHFRLRSLHADCDFFDLSGASVVSFLVVERHIRSIVAAYVGTLRASVSVIAFIVGCGMGSTVPSSWACYAREDATSVEKTAHKMAKSFNCNFMMNPEF